MAIDTSPSPYLDNLPQMFRQTVPPGNSVFLGQYLKIFEAMLSGRDDAGELQSLGQKILAFASFLDPATTPAVANASGSLDSEFLTYLARWVGLVLDQNWNIAKKRQWLERIVPLYKKRGTRAGMEEYLRMFVGDNVEIEEPPAGGIIVGVPENAIVGENTFIGGGPAYFFRVKIYYGLAPGTFDIDEWNNIQVGTKTIIDLEKPAHTYYELDARTAGIIVGVRATVGEDTLIWHESALV